MTETRKKIIELISDYMDKTLSFWCLVEYWWIYQIIKKNSWISTEFSEYYITIPAEWQKEWTKIDINWNYKTIWHYDITAVLKYVESIKWVLKWRIFSDAIVNEEWNFETNQEDEIVIKNKPLHLYTEEENKELLETLKSISKCDA